MRFLSSLLSIAIAFALVPNVFANEPDNPGEPDDPGRVPAKIVRPIAENYDDAHRKFQCVATICATDDSRLWIAWYAGGMGEGEDNYILLATSDDGGRTWSKPLFAIDPEGPPRAFDEILWADPNGRVWLFWGQNVMNRTPVGQWEIHTDNPQDGENANWSEPRRICDGVMLNKPIVDSQGRWLYPIQEPRGAAVYLSTDQGRTVEFLSVGTRPEPELRGADEHNLVEKTDGSLWIYNRLGQPGIGETFSTDGGKTWSEFKISEIQHCISRFVVRRLRSGNLLMVKHGELNEYCGRSRLTAFLSQDDGKTWSDGLTIEPRFRCSYPDVDQSPNGYIYIAYDRNRGLEREIFVAKITEDDLRAGKLVSKESQLNIIANRPTDVFRSWWEAAVRYPGADGKPGAYWETGKVLETIQEIERNERAPIKNF